MPFDAAPSISPEPNLADLARVLREGPTGPDWPSGLEWDYFYPSSCACGISNRLWPDAPKYGGRGRSKLFGISEKDTGYIFFNPLGDTSPAGIAARIEKVLAGTRDRESAGWHKGRG